MGIMHKVALLVVLVSLCAGSATTASAASCVDSPKPLQVVGKPIKGLLNAVFGKGQSAQDVEGDREKVLIPTSGEPAKKKRKLFGRKADKKELPDQEDAVAQAQKKELHDHHDDPTSGMTASWEQVSFALENPSEFREYQIEIIAAALHRELATSGCTYQSCNQASATG